MRVGWIGTQVTGSAGATLLPYGACCRVIAQEQVLDPRLLGWLLHRDRRGYAANCAIYSPEPTLQRQESHSAAHVQKL